MHACLCLDTYVCKHHEIIAIFSPRRGMNMHVCAWNIHLHAGFGPFAVALVPRRDGGVQRFNGLLGGHTSLTTDVNLHACVCMVQGHACTYVHILQN
jgi:hypothetical protein